jgi:hypothetical protein
VLLVEGVVADVRHVTLPCVRGGGTAAPRASTPRPTALS